MIRAQQRVVVVSRPTWFEQLLRRHGTRQQAEFFLKTRGQSIEQLEDQHEQFLASLRTVSSAIPRDWRRAKIERADLDRFLFEPQDLVIVIGQDGLVANVAKYLGTQPVIGVNPSPEQYDGVLVQHPPDDVAVLLAQHQSGQLPTMERTKVQAVLDDGQRLSALNELFIGHSSHQSARYEIACESGAEFQSSSGVIVATGTGATGWARSIHQQSQSEIVLPGPTEQRLVHFTREAWPSMTTGTTLTSGELDKQSSLTLTSRMEGDGVIFGDGIEADRLEFNWGRVVQVSVAKSGLVVPAADQVSRHSVH